MKNPYKFFISAASIVIITIIVFGYTYNHNRTDTVSKKSLSTSANIAHSGYDRIEYTYEETIEQCTHIVEAVYEGSEIVDNYNDLKFSVVDKIKGDMSDSLIYE